MAFSKLTRILLYVVAGISILVILFFYVGPRTLDYDALEVRVEELANPVDADFSTDVPAVDTATPDTAAVAATGQDTLPSDTAEDQEEADNTFAAAEVMDTSGVDLREHLSTWEYLVYFRTDIALIWAYILLILTAIAALVFPLIAIFTNMKALIRLVGVLAGAAVLIVISYLLASDSPISIIGYTGTANRDPGTLKMVDTTLFVTYLLFGLALLSILYSIVSKAFK
jgi:hypothetical protein